MNLNKRGSNRRDFLGLSAGTLAALACGCPRLLFGEDKEKQTLAKISPTADSVILLFMPGGMAHTETFDPKPYVEMPRGGLEHKQIMSTFKSIDTAVDSIKFSEGLEHMAKVMDRGALIRSIRPVWSGHVPAMYHWYTGYRDTFAIDAPGVGAMIARILGPRHPDMPANIKIRTQRIAEQPQILENVGYETAGFLGTEYAPFVIPDVSQALQVVRPKIQVDRFENRQKLYKDLMAQSPVGQVGSAYQKESMERAMDGAYRLMTSPVAKAFDLSQEKQEVANAYKTSPYGEMFLLARRLVEHGARFVEVRPAFNSKTFNGRNAQWDSHKSGHQMYTDMKNLYDAPMAQLIMDLEQRGLLDRTLVVIASEFSRTHDQGNGKVEDYSKYGFHGHFSGASCALLFGGGVKKGVVYGKTADEFPCAATDNIVAIEDVHATIYHTLGIPSDYALEVEKRPFKVTQDGAGKAIKEILA